MRFINRFVVIGIVVLIAPSSALAGQPAGGHFSFSQGTWALEISASHGEPIRYSDEEVFTAALGVGYYFLDDMAIIGRATFVSIDHEPGSFPVDAVGGGVDGLLRWHVLHIGDDFTFYLDGGGGRFWTDEPSPPGGTTYNWIGRAGLGATWKIGERTHLIGGARYYHYSNGDVHGRINNPGHDGVEGYVGLVFTW